MVLSANCSQLNPTKFILYTAILDLMKKNPETVFCLLRRSGKKAHHSQISVPLHCLLGVQLTLNRHQLPLFTLKHDLSGNWQANLTSLAKGKEGATVQHLQDISANMGQESRRRIGAEGRTCTHEPTKHTATNNPTARCPDNS